ncbi:hypothetical protein O9929_00965 [Vibrio lentus]|nr:hypothetical protein [Vibrio lentus]
MNAWVEEGIVNYLGTSDNVEAEIAKVDCMVLPSFYREGVPKSLREAHAMGRRLLPQIMSVAARRLTMALTVTCVSFALRSLVEKQARPMKPLHVSSVWLWVRKVALKFENDLTSKLLSEVFTSG